MEENGTKLVMNLDALRETKNDPKVGAIILQELLKLEDVTIHSDFCDPKTLLKVYTSLVTMRRPDPALAEKASTKKPSHSLTDMHYVMSCLRKNM